MTKHVLDREHASEGARAQRYAEIERHNGPEGSHRAAQTLFKRPQTRGETRTEQFLRIQRQGQ